MKTFFPERGRPSAAPLFLCSQRLRTTGEILKITAKMKEMGFQASATPTTDCLGLQKLVRGSAFDFQNNLHRLKIAYIYEEMRNAFPDLSCQEIADKIGYHVMTLNVWRNRFVLGR